MLCRALKAQGDGNQGGGTGDNTGNGDNPGGNDSEVSSDGSSTDRFTYDSYVGIL